MPRAGWQSSKGAGSFRFAPGVDTCLIASEGRLQSCARADARGTSTRTPTSPTSTPRDPGRRTLRWVELTGRMRSTSPEPRRSRAAPSSTSTGRLEAPQRRRPRLYAHAVAADRGGWLSTGRVLPRGLLGGLPARLPRPLRLERETCGRASRRGTPRRLAHGRGAAAPRPDGRRR